jgi:hypothetical protein
MAELRINAMSGWLSRAKSAFGGREAEISPEPIEIACPCGCKVEAMRRRDFQRVLCKNCGEPFFLLPLDVYPRPVMKVRKFKPPKPDVKKKSASVAKTSTAQTASAPSRPTIDLGKNLSAFGTQVRNQFTPLRLMVLSLVAVIGLTGWWQWNRAARSAAELDFKAAMELGQAALQKKAFVEAAEHFALAARAVDVLGQHDVPAEQARQLYRQLTVINSLMNPSLIELLISAKEGRAKGEVAAIESEFASLHAGRWIVLQSEATPATEPAKSAKASIWEQRLQLDGETLLLTGSLSIFSKVRAPTSPLAAPEGNAVPDAPLEQAIVLNDLGQREVLFAAQAESLKWNKDDSVWVLKLKSSTGCLWTDYDLLVEIGLPPDDLHNEPHLRALLLEQSRWIGAAK